MSVIIQILRDPIWQGIGVLLALLIAFLGFFHQTKQKIWLYASGAIIFFLIAFCLGAEAQRYIDAANNDSAIEPTQTSHIITDDFTRRITVVPPTYTPFPTYTPQPTYTPLPTYTPQIVSIPATTVPQVTNIVSSENPFIDPFDSLSRDNWDFKNTSLSAKKGLLVGNGILTRSIGGNNYKIKAKVKGSQFSIYTRRNDKGEGYSFNCNSSYCEWRRVYEDCQATSCNIILYPYSPRIYRDEIKFDTQNFYDITVTATGGSFSVNLGENNIFSTSDNTYTNGKVGIAITDASFDSIEITPLP